MDNLQYNRYICKTYGVAHTQANFIHIKRPVEIVQETEDDNDHKQDQLIKISKEALT